MRRFSGEFRTGNVLLASAAAVALLTALAMAEIRGACGGGNGQTAGATVAAMAEASDMALRIDRLLGSIKGSLPASAGEQAASRATFAVITPAKFKPAPRPEPIATSMTPQVVGFERQAFAPVLDAQRTAGALILFMLLLYVPLIVFVSRVEDD